MGDVVVVADVCHISYRDLVVWGGTLVILIHSVRCVLHIEYVLSYGRLILFNRSVVRK